jgi:hypothetical protein
MAVIHEPHAAMPGATCTSPSRSRMLTFYLAHIEHLLHTQRWDAARREAGDLPRIAVALAHPQLRASADRVHAWCEQWLGTQCATWNIWPFGERTGDEHVPAAALRRLRLHRLAPPSCRTPGWAGPLPSDIDTARQSTLLVDATRRWYARSACHDATVQGNLARLAVLH